MSVEEEEQLFPPIPFDINYSNVVIVDCIPVIPKEKEDKLRGVIKKIFEQFGAVKEIFMPFVNNESQGFAFITYQNEDSANRAVEKLNNHKLDSKHTFLVNRYEDFEAYSKLTQEYQPPQEETTESSELLQQWLLDEFSRDQFVVRYSDDTEIYWQGISGTTPKMDTNHNKWTDSFVSWSPRGTYLVTYHKLGIILWGGPSWKKLRRFRHTGVTTAEFSPNEKYLLTLSFVENDNPKDPQSISLWDVRTGQRIRGFMKLYGSQWPEFYWSHDDKYFSRINKGVIGVYETPTIKLLDDKPIELHAPAQDHAWSPTNNYLAVFVPENQSIPAKVVLMEIPSRRVVGQQALFNVIGCRMHWQEEGKYLAVKVDRHGKSKKQTFTSFEFFEVKEKGIPVEHLDLVDNVIAFSWEPKGSRFAIIHDADSQSATRPNVSIYDMAGDNLQLKITLAKKPANHLYWSPAGRYIVLAGLKSLNGKLEFYDAHTLSSMAEREHSMCTDVTWDPTGRYVTTWVCNWKSKSENGYRIWPFHGQKELTTAVKDPFHQFMWRPRPPSLLTQAQLNDIDKNMKSFHQKFTKQDKEKDLIRLIEEEREKNTVRSAFRKLLGDRKREWEADADWRRKELGMVPEKDD